MAMGMDMGMMGGPEPDADEAGGPSDADTDDFEPKTDEEREAKSALDDTAPMADRVASLLEAIRLCSEKDYGGKTPAAKKPGIDLALIMGGPKKKG